MSGFSFKGQISKVVKKRSLFTHTIAHGFLIVWEKKLLKSSKFVHASYENVFVCSHLNTCICY